MASQTRTDANEQPQDAPNTQGARPDDLTASQNDRAGDGNSLAVLVPRAPGWLMLARIVTGLALLAMAWGTLMVALLLAFNTLGIPPHRHVIVRIALYIVGALGALWLGVVALAALIVGAFCLTLALTRRQW